MLRARHRDPPAGDPTGCLPWEVREEYRSVLDRIASRGEGAAAPRRHWGITSCVSGEGVSTVAVQLAAAAASSGGRPVLLVDANLARPSLDGVFGVPLGPGLTDVLVSGESPCAAIRSTATAHLSLLTAGTACEELADRCDQADLGKLLDALPADFELVVFDLPSADQRSLLARLARPLDGVLLVVGAEGISGEAVRRTERLLSERGLPLEGVLLNKSRDYVPSWLRSL